MVGDSKTGRLIMRFLIVGAGALGGYYGGMLLKGGADVTFLVRPRRAAQLAEQGLIIRRAEGEFRTPVRTVRAGAIDGSYDVALLACKAYDLDAAIDDFAPALSPAGAVLPILNGINHIETLVARFGRERVLGGLGMVNGELTPEGVIAFRLAADNHISFGELDGQLSGRCEDIRTAFATGGVPSTVSDRIMAEMWGKFCGYAVAATLATLTRARARRDRGGPVRRRLRGRRLGRMRPGHRRRRLSAAARDRGFRARAILPARLRLPAVDCRRSRGGSADRGRAYDWRSGAPRRSPRARCPDPAGGAVLPADPRSPP
jgi:2-dehydropantoate 2-reductase